MQNLKGSAGGLIEWAGYEPRLGLAIVFSDILGSTALKEGLGDERWAEVQVAHFAQADRFSGKYRGYKVETAGDNVLATFRSVGVALDYAIELYLDPGHSALQDSGIRLGIHFGEANIIRDGNSEGVSGTNVDFAARVQQAGAGAEIWLSGQARQGIDQEGSHRHRELRWLQLDNVHLKGFKGEWTLWSLIPDPTARRTNLNAERPLTPGITKVSVVPVQQATSNGRTVFVARPANDMRGAYVRIVDELRGRGFVVVPESDIPNDETATSFIDTAIAQAELAIHLLGTRLGFTPDTKEGLPIGKLQLARAARQATKRKKTAAGPEFVRVLWAPKIFEEIGSGMLERDPQIVLAQFGELIAGDKLIGDNLVQFVDFLLRHLDKNRPRSLLEQSRVPLSGEKIFICHAPEDYEYATELAEAVQQRSLAPCLSMHDPDADFREVDSVNRKEMRECSRVALCWGSARELWMMHQKNKINGWRSRTQPFQVELLAAPPSHKTKDRWLRVRLSGIDRVIDITDVVKPAPENLDPWLGPQPGTATFAKG